MKTTLPLAASRRVMIPRSDLLLAQAAGGAVHAIKTKQGQRYYVSKIIASAILVAKRAAVRTGQHAIDILRALDTAKAVEDASRMETVRDEYLSDPINSVLAEILGIPVTAGAVRANPDGTFHVLFGSVWVPASNDLLNAWDAERRLGATREMHHLAAETILRWKAGQK